VPDKVYIIWLPIKKGTTHMKLIDADKLRQHVLDNWEMERHGGTDASGIRAEVWAELNDSLQSDTFDPTPVQPDTREEQ
jgi:hypothetical protein